MWETTGARSLTVGPFTLLWRVCLYVWNSRHDVSLTCQESSSGQDFSSFPATAPQRKTLLLVESRTPTTSDARRWRLTSESAVWLDSAATKRGRSSGECGDSPVGDGAGLFGTLTRTIST